MLYATLNGIRDKLGEGCAKMDGTCDRLRAIVDNMGGIDDKLSGGSANLVGLGAKVVRECARTAGARVMVSEKGEVNRPGRLSVVG